MLHEIFAFSDSAQMGSFVDLLSHGDIIDTMDVP